MIDVLREVTFETAVGVAIWLVSLIWPMRRFATRAEVGWDVFAALCAVAFAWVAAVSLDRATDWISLALDVWYAVIEELPLWVVAPAYVVLADLGAYWAHRALHTRVLWSTHAWHHSPRNLYWLAGLRGSPVHILVLIAPYFLAFMLFPFEAAFIVSVALATLDAGNQHLIHSNLKLPFPGLLERVFVTPRYHFVHHNAKIEVANSNYGFVFSIWDRLFGTYTDPETIPIDAPLGLDYEIGNWRLALGLPARPPKTNSLS
jgi:sterol desaturase/sphingolipid hydroxylase (fatty acid hydroxylase superfamily)